MSQIVVNGVSLFKSGHSLDFRLSKYERELLGVDENTEFDKILDLDTHEIIFRKKSSKRKER